jgi:NitT/TauT family transport system permease protein
LVLALIPENVSGFRVFCCEGLFRLESCPEASSALMLFFITRYERGLEFEMDLAQPRKYSAEQSTLRQISGGWLWMPVSFLVGVVGWYLFALWMDFPAFILPTPQLVFERLLRALADGSLMRHSLITLSEVLAGLGLGMSIATLLGYLIAKSPRLERFLSPYIVASQSIPIVAIAPLLIIWFKSGLLSKVFICALIVFFPILVNVVVGLRSVPKDLRDLMRSLRATRWQMLVHLEIPAALPVLLGGLRIGATLSVIGAVVGEYVGADRGLGFLINVGRGQYDTALVFVAIFALVTMAMSLYGLVVLLENRLLSWHQAERYTK